MQTNLIAIKYYSAVGEYYAKRSEIQKLLVDCVYLMLRRCYAVTARLWQFSLWLAKATSSGYARKYMAWGAPIVCKEQL